MRPRTPPLGRARTDLARRAMLLSDRPQAETRFRLGWIRFDRLESSLAAGFSTARNGPVQVPRFLGDLLESLLGRPLPAHPNRIDDCRHDRHRICRLAFHPPASSVSDAGI